MRTVSFFGPKEGGSGGGRTEPDSGREAVGGFGGGKKLVDEYLREQTAVRMEQTDYRFVQPATGFGQSHAVSRSAPAGSAAAGSTEVEPATGCEPSLFSVGQVRPLLLEKLTKQSPILSLPES